MKTAQNFLVGTQSFVGLRAPLSRVYLLLVVLVIVLIDYFDAYPALDACWNAPYLCLRMQAEAHGACLKVAHKSVFRGI